MSHRQRKFDCLTLLPLLLGSAALAQVPQDVDSIRAAAAAFARDRLQVLVTTRALPRNATVTAQDVQLQRRRVPGVVAAYLTSPEQLAGRHLRNAAAPGMALEVEMLSPDVLIRRGQRVTLVASAGSLEVRAQGEAIADAQADGRVRVLNLASRRIVEGRVESRDSVRIGL